MLNPPINEHDWPADTSQHVWGRWFNKVGKTKFRKCVHPQCGAIEEKDFT